MIHTLIPLVAVGLLFGAPAPASHFPARAVPAVATRADGEGVPVGTPNPAKNVPVTFNGICMADGYTSGACAAAALADINQATVQEGGKAMRLPPDYGSLAAPEQLFVLANLERGAFGMALIPGMNATLNHAAQAGAVANTDPVQPAAFPQTMMGAASNWASVQTPLLADFYWMYDDGLGSFNLDCTVGNMSGCWGHRDNILLSWHTYLSDNGWMAAGSPPTTVVAGAASAPSTFAAGQTSYAEIFMAAQGTPTMTYTWAQALASYQGASPWVGTITAPTPASIAIGSLWRQSGASPVYLVTSSHTLYHVPSPLAFHDLNLNWAAIQVTAALPALPMSFSMAIPTGSLWQVSGQSAIYMVTPANTLYHVPNPAAFYAFHDHWSQVQDVASLPSLPIAATF